jgi:hypothetical protein
MEICWVNLFPVPFRSPDVRFLEQVWLLAARGRKEAMVWFCRGLGARGWVVGVDRCTVLYCLGRWWSGPRRCNAPTRNAVTDETTFCYFGKYLCSDRGGHRGSLSGAWAPCSNALTLMPNPPACMRERRFRPMHVQNPVLPILSLSSISLHAGKAINASRN